jgi:hypothetical protein
MYLFTQIIYLYQCILMNIYFILRAIIQCVILYFVVQFVLALAIENFCALLTCPTLSGVLHISYFVVLHIF